MPRMTKEEKRWQAEMDAATLAEAKAIKESASRLSAAKTVAKTMAKDAQARADELKSISRERPKPSQKKSRTSTQKSNRRNTGNKLTRGL